MKKEELSEEELDRFLNTPPTAGEGERGDLRSLWSLVRRSLSNTGMKLVLGDAVRLTAPDVSLNWSKRKDSNRVLHNLCQQSHMDILTQAKDQGRTFSTVKKHPVSNHWIPTGRYVSFSEYRFAIKARLNLLPVKTVQRRFQQSQMDTRCRQCHQHPETLSHVVNHCLPNMGLIRQRHNQILARLTKAVPNMLGAKHVEQEVPGDPQRNKPDLVVTSEDQKTAYIVDVTLPFEGEDSMEQARERKLAKYAQLKQWMVEEKGYTDVYLGAFVVGSLGSWDPENEEVLRKLQVRRNYAKLFRKLCVSSAISGSYDIWRAHCQR